MDLNKNQQIVSDYLTSNYDSVDRYENSDIQLTTKEFFKRIDAHFPDLFTQSQFSDLLLDLGFKFYDDELKFEWILKTKN